MQTAIIAIIQALIAGVPKLIELAKSGRDPKDVKLGEFISSDALETIRDTNKRVDDFVNG